MIRYYSGTLFYIKSSKKIATLLKAIDYTDGYVWLEGEGSLSLKDVRRVTIFEAFVFRIGQLFKWVLFQFFPNR